MLTTKILTDDRIPPGTIHFVVPRKCEIIVLPNGTRQRVWLESEEEWAKKCAVITGVES